MKRFQTLMTGAMGLALMAAAPMALAETALPAAVPQGYALGWAEEFELDGLPNAKHWVYDTEANKTGWYNNELQYYAVARPENSNVKDGVLHITARKESLTDQADYGGQKYSSARLITRGKVSFLYGFFEIRAKMPCGTGTWPAIWMLGTQAGWPDGGEIDIMEHVGKDPEMIYGTVHNRATAGTFGVGNGIKIKDACSAFHNYQLHWTPEKLDFLVDGKLYHSYPNPGTAAGWPYDKPQYLLLNLAIGGNMAGAVDDKIFPRTFEVDYVRVYQKTAE